MSACLRANKDLEKQNTTELINQMILKRLSITMMLLLGLRIAATVVIFISLLDFYNTNVSMQHYLAL